MIEQSRGESNLDAKGIKNPPKRKKRRLLLAPLNVTDLGLSNTRALSHGALGQACLQTVLEHKGAG